MKFNNRKNLIMTTLAMFTSLLFAVSSLAKDWHELEEMTKVDLLGQIEQFKSQLGKTPDNVEVLKAIGIAYHVLAQEDQKEFAPKSKEYLERAFSIDKKDYEVMCYLGSITCMMAKTTFNPVKKMSYSNDGLALMDKAVARQPDNISVLMVRGITQSRLPAFFKRKKTAVSDFEKLEYLLQKKENVTPILKTVYTHLANLYLDDGQKEKANMYIEKQKHL